VKLPPLDAPTTDLLKVVNKAGVRFRVMGGQLKVTGHAPPELRPVLDVLRTRKSEILDILGVTEADQASIDLLASLGMTPIIPVTEAEAKEVMAEIIMDSVKITPASV
jgi:hypothetical protein